ncbi:hypothetical protein HJC23_010485 [Cyclotella cryptica]|uniref:Uncharacterized protein n=1 Tax=Cyclotella cryptica TaxID=29204 RepID=A0ABD3QBB8_9STRA
MHSSTSTASLIFLCLLCKCIHAFHLPIVPSATLRRVSAAPSSTALQMAGFASSKTKGGTSGSKLPKLKAKSQWDRYADLKNCQKVRVGVRIKDSEEWLEVGRVKSENNEFTEVAVARQRALIAEHAKRLYLVQIPPNAVLEWGYLMQKGSSDDEDDGDNGEWILVDKSKGDEAPSGIEKKIGFEGKPDKNTGFYCYYHEGRIVEREDGGKGKKKPVV